MADKGNNGCLDDLGCLVIIFLLFLAMGGHLFVRCGGKSLYIGTEPEQKEVVEKSS